MEKITELERLKQGIKNGSVKLPKPPPQKVKGRQIMLVNNIEIGGDRLEDIEYITELSTVLNWCLYTKDLKEVDRRFQAKRNEFAYIFYKNGKIYHFGQSENDLLFVVI